MAKIHDLFIIELAEVIKGYGNDPDVEDPFRLSEFYRFYELPNIAVSRENFEKMRPVEPERWIPCSERLPEERDAGILKKLGTNKRSDYVLITVDVKGERMTSVGCTYDGIWNWDKKYAFPNYEAIAWMPLPEPYKGEQE